MIAVDSSGPQGIAVDDSRVYWTHKSDGTIKSAPLAGGEVSVLATGQTQPANVRVDATHVYWTDTGGGAIMKVAK